jgi:dihydroxyacetone kinase
VIGVLQLALFVVGSTQLVASVTGHGHAANLLYLGFLFASSVITGAYFEHSARYPWLESARAVVVGTIVLSTGAWFGRSLEGMSLIMLGLVAANFVAAWLFVAVRVARARPMQSGKLHAHDRRAA